MEARRRHDRRDGRFVGGPDGHHGLDPRGGGPITWKHASDNKDNVILEGKAAAGVGCLDVLYEVMIAVL